MRKFIFRILLYCVPIIALFVLSEYILRTIPNDYKYKSQWLEKNASSVECLVLGSSHTFFGIQPACFACNTFNAAHVSQSIKFDSYIFRKYIDQMDSLRYVVQPISYGTLLSSLEKGIEAWRIKYYTIYYNYPSYMLWDNFELFPMNKSTWKRMGRYMLMSTDLLTVDSLGWSGTYFSENKSLDWKNTGRVAAERHTKTYDANQLEINLSYLEDMIQICYEKGVLLFLLNTPTYITYRENLNAQQLFLMDSVCSYLANKHEHVYRLDYFADIAFVDEDFYDADHLCEIGAKKLSEKISHDIDSIAYRCVR